jgi:putative NADH-flavin reductase
MLPLATTRGGAKKVQRKIPQRRLITGLAFAVCGLTLQAASVAAADAMARPLKITVYGGTGRIGQRIVNEALRRGHRVTILVRDPSVVKDKRARLSYVRGDVLDSAAVARQIAGQDVVILAIRAGSQPGVPRDDGPDAPAPTADHATAATAPPPPLPTQGDHFYVRAAQSVVAALRSLGDQAPRLIHVGGAASLLDDSGKRIIDSAPPSLPRNADPFTQTEALDYYRTVKDVKWTLVSPSMEINPGERTGKFRLGTDTLLTAANGVSAISMEDFAVAIIDEAEKPQFIRKRFTVGY